MRWATLLLALAGCHGGLHARGEHQLLADVSYGIPAQGILGTDAPDARNVGARVSGGTFIEDRILIFVAGSYRRYDVDPGTAEAWEIQFGPRYYPPLEFHLGGIPAAVFLDGTFGVALSSDAFPAGGSDKNLTGEWGGGLELMTGEKTSVVLGYRFRHLSTGGGLENENPGYNDHQLFAGFAWRW